ncbi:endonuclease-reverse transcriptase [Plakobranchus ocellatus]|uniref:Endonuclease-reverse transcriptase n=1 Tax=Plakobranchus ocellatus TaxID=259542 RepID=A0AAV4DTQ6_9GAST|nr:endonuclease-reverse transcriptase [Plakobranchus ocellatus]
MASSVQEISISESRLKEIRDISNDWALSNGITMKVSPEENHVMCVPYSLFPSPVPSQILKLAKSTMTDFSRLMHKVAMDHEFLTLCLKNVIQVDPFIHELWKIYLQVREAGIKQTNVLKNEDIKRGVRQGCVLSPDLFSLYSEIIMRNLENHPGIKVGGQNINNLRYADDTVLIAENKEDLQKLLNIVEEESRKKGLELNSKKTEVMVISRKQESPKCDIFINKVKLKQTEKFKYLGTIISNNGKTNREISARNAQAKINFQKMKTILTNKHISMETRKRALQCYIEPVLMYGCEAWTISKQIQNKLEATEM